MTSGFLSIDVTKSQLMLPIIKPLHPAVKFQGQERKVSVLLPFDYFNSNKYYPVLYLQDGQNLFDKHAPFGNWDIDNAMASLAEQNQHEVILVCIDHGSEERIHEFSPYSRPGIKSADGISYVDFIVDTLKPEVDKSFRTLVGRAHTAIGGSSLGGIISLYAGMKFPEVFGKWMIFSPSLWAAAPLFSEASKLQMNSPTDVFFYAGAMESPTMEAHTRRFVKILEKNHQANAHFKLQLLINPNGIHNESEWGRVFPNALKWLYFDAIE